MFPVAFICNLLIPLVMIMGGKYMVRNQHGRINDTIGYRTRMSKMNADTWAFAHETCGWLWIRWGTLLFIPSLIVQILFRYASDEAVGIMTLCVEGVQVAVILLSIVQVEKALKNTFDKDGNRIMPLKEDGDEG